MRLIRIPRIFSVLLLVACAATPTILDAQQYPNPNDHYGVLVMAHGGSVEWNADVLRAVAPLANHYPIEVAFGMADPATLQEAIERLEARGVAKIGVVRLFISGESWLERTEQILGLRPGAAAAPEHHDHHAAGEGPEAAAGSHGSHHSMALWRVRSRATFALSTEGLAEADEIGPILVDRARAQSRDPAREQVLVLAHGTDDDDANDRWVTWMNAQAEAVRQALPFRRVQVMTLREDWPAKREAAVQAIRAAVASAGTAGITTIIIPFRVQGFGPYAQVLDGLEYRADGQGLLPHPAVTDWIARQADMLRRKQ